MGVFKPRMGATKNIRARLESMDCNHVLCPDDETTGAHQDQEISLDGGVSTGDINLRRRKLAPSGIRKNLVVLMRFKDHVNKALPSRNDIDILFNGDDQACANSGICEKSGSVKSYWKKFSHGNLEIQSTVAEWVTVPFTEAEAADNSHG